MFELIGERQENSKTYDLADGRRHLVVSIGAIHYKDNYADPTEQWKDIDLTWEGNKITKAPFELTLEANKITVKDKKTGDISTIELIDVKPAGLNFEVIPFPEGVHFRHTLPSDKIPFEAKFKVTGRFITRAFDDEDELELETTLIGDVLTEKLSQVKDKLTGKLRPAKGQIRIDPTLTVQPSAKDAFLQQAAPNSNFGTGVVIIQSYTGANRRALIEFSLTGLPAGATITAATLSLYYYYYELGNPVGRTYWIYRLTRTDWVELEATWNNYKAATAWTTAGGDYTTTDGASTTVPSAYGWMNWNVLAQVQYAYSAGIPAEFLGRDANEAQTSAVYNAWFHSREYTTDTTLRPKLVIEYIALVAKTSSDAGSGVEALLNRGLMLADTAVGAEALIQTVTLVKADSGVGVESLLDRALASAEAGSGVDALVALLYDAVVSDTGSGLDALIELRELLELFSSDAGSGIDTLTALKVALMQSDTGTGHDTARLLAALLSTDHALSTEVAAIVLKALRASDRGIGIDRFIAKIETAAVGGDMRLPTGIPGAVAIPSKEVSPSPW